MHKFVYEALMRILFTQMKTNLTDSEELEAFELQISNSVESSDELGVITMK